MRARSSRRCATPASSCALGAFLIDSVVLGAFGLPLAAAGYFGIRAGMLVIGHAEPIEPDETLLTLLIAGWFAMATVYFTVLHHTYGQTIGKSLLRAEAPHASTSARSASCAASSGRSPTPPRRASSASASCWWP